MPLDSKSAARARCYVEFARVHLGWAADRDSRDRHRGTVTGARSNPITCAARSRCASRAPLFFAGKLIFQKERWYQRICCTTRPRAAVDAGYSSLDCR